MKVSPLKLSRWLVAAPVGMLTVWMTARTMADIVSDDPEAQHVYYAYSSLEVPCAKALSIGQIETPNPNYAIQVAVILNTYSGKAFAHCVEHKQDAYPENKQSIPQTYAPLPDSWNNLQTILDALGPNPCGATNNIVWMNDDAERKALRASRYVNTFRNTNYHPLALIAGAL